MAKLAGRLVFALGVDDLRAALALGFRLAWDLGVLGRECGGDQVDDRLRRLLR
ncbi:MAG: hypothetical protein L0Z51_11720 [Candidatus Latescibacteria bacterium]|nr:hypothetical protein [Candidatus Latescibacterota bacterium]